MSEIQERTMRSLTEELRAAQAILADIAGRRNALIGEMIDDGYTTYAVAKLADIKQPNVVQINNVQKGGTPRMSPAPRGASNQPRAGTSNQLQRSNT